MNTQQALESADCVARIDTGTAKCVQMAERYETGKSLYHAEDHNPDINGMFRVIGFKLLSRDKVNFYLKKVI